MDIKYHVSWPSNLFHIVDNTSMWSKHSRKRIRDLYEEHFGISKTERLLLSDYSKIREMHGWKRLDRDFIPKETYEQAMASAKKRLNEQDFSVLSGVFEHFEKNARVLYDGFEPLLKRRKENLESALKHHDIEAMVQDVAAFFKTNYIPEDVNVYLLINPEEWGGYCVGSKNRTSYVTLEPLDLSYFGENIHERLNQDLCVILHEISHDVLGNSNNPRNEYISHLVKTNVLDSDDVRILTEAILDTLYSDGALAVKNGLKDELSVAGEMDYLKNMVIPDEKADPSGYNYALRGKLRANIYPLTLDQLSKNLSALDGNYLERAADILVSLKPGNVA